MYAAIWSAIGILAAALFGSIYFSVQRMDAGFARLETRLEGRIDRLEIRMDQGFARLEARVDAHIDRHAG